MSAKKLLALWGLKWNPFTPELPGDALLVTALLFLATIPFIALRGGEAAFAEEALTHLRRIELMFEHLQGDATPGRELFGLVDRAHAAGA